MFVPRIIGCLFNGALSKCGYEVNTSNHVIGVKKPESIGVILGNELNPVKAASFEASPVGSIDSIPPNP